MGYGAGGHVGGNPLTLTSTPSAFARRLFYRSILNFSDIKNVVRGSKLKGDFCAMEGIHMASDI